MVKPRRLQRPRDERAAVLLCHRRERDYGRLFCEKLPHSSLELSCETGNPVPAVNCYRITAAWLSAITARASLRVHAISATGKLESCSGSASQLEIRLTDTPRVLLPCSSNYSQSPWRRLASNPQLNGVVESRSRAHRDLLRACSSNEGPIRSAAHMPNGRYAQFRRWGLGSERARDDDTARRIVRGGSDPYGLSIARKRRGITRRQDARRQTARSGTETSSC
jgi:hypothetical protein